MQPPEGVKTRSFDFGTGPVTCLRVPWGDLATAFYSTGISNIEVYLAVSGGQRLFARLARWLAPVLAARPVQAFLKSRVQAGKAGPSTQERRREHGRGGLERRMAGSRGGRRPPGPAVLRQR